MSVCLDPHCELPSRASGYCRKHYQRAYRATQRRFKPSFTGERPKTRTSVNNQCRACNRDFGTEQSYWLHRGWPYYLKDKRPPAGWVGECLDGFEGGLWPHPDGKLRGYPPEASR